MFLENYLGGHRPIWYHHIRDNKRDVIQQGIPDNDSGVAGRKEVFKILGPIPWAFEYTVIHVVLFEGNNYSRHRYIVVDKKIDDPRQHHQIKRQKLHPFSYLTHSLQSVSLQSQI